MLLHHQAYLALLLLLQKLVWFSSRFGKFPGSTEKVEHAGAIQGGSI
jgi:hypothetical protein